MEWLTRERLPNNWRSSCTGDQRLHALHLRMTPCGCAYHMWKQLYSYACAGLLLSSLVLTWRPSHRKLETLLSNIGTLTSKTKAWSLRHVCLDKNLYCTLSLLVQENTQGPELKKTWWQEEGNNLIQSFPALVVQWINTANLYQLMLQLWYQTSDIVALTDKGW